MSAINYGLSVLALSMQSNADERAKAQEKEIKNLNDGLKNHVFRAKGQVHGLRAMIHGHKIAENELIAALKAENANHPLASREAVDAAMMDAYARSLLDPDVIKRTYPDGKLPDGVVFPPHETVQVA